MSNCSFHCHFQKEQESLHHSWTLFHPRQHQHSSQLISLTRGWTRSLYDLWPLPPLMNVDVEWVKLFVYLSSIYTDVHLQYISVLSYFLWFLFVNRFMCYSLYQVSLYFDNFSFFNKKEKSIEHWVIVFCFKSETARVVSYINSAILWFSSVNALSTVYVSEHMSCDLTGAQVAKHEILEGVRL